MKPITAIVKEKSGPMFKRFKSHKMYKNGEEEVAETNKEHLSLKKEGYAHDSPAKCWKTHKRVPGTKKGAKGSCEPKKK